MRDPVIERTADRLCDGNRRSVRRRRRADQAPDGHGEYRRALARPRLVLVFPAGGRRLNEIVPDTGVEPPPGSVGEQERRAHVLVSRAEHFQAIEDRLAQLVQSGLREDVLVRALRDDLTIRLREYAEVDEANERGKTCGET